MLEKNLVRVQGVNMVGLLTFRDGKGVKDVKVVDFASLLLQIGWNLTLLGGRTMPTPIPGG